jgi:uncharacterized protein (TIGR02453 family)
MQPECDNLFKGFSTKTFEFLMNLEFNNNKAWFEENKQTYKDEVVKPFQDLIKALLSYMLTIDPTFDTRADVGKTISRIYRDVRFSKDKKPYRSAVWLTFKRVSVDWKLEPCFFFEVTPSIYRYGMGFFIFSKEMILKLRELIDNDSEDFRNILALYLEQKIFTLQGEKYKKILDKGKSEEVLNWYQRKEIYFMCEKKIDKKLFETGLVEDLKKDFEVLRPFYEFLWKLKE